MEWSASQQNMISNRSSQDSAVGSARNSYPLQDSQSSGLSQITTQDLFSQNNCSTRNQIETSKPSSMYEKWKSRQAMMKRESCMPSQGVAVGQTGLIPGSAAKTPFSGLGRWDSRSSINSVCSNVGVTSNRGKPDLDDRKLMEHMIYVIRDCNNEVKSTVMALMEHLDKMRDVSDDQLSKSMSLFLEKLWAHEEVLKNLIQGQNANRADPHELEINLAKKDAQLSLLEEQLAEAKKGGNQKYTEDLKSEIQSLQFAFMSKQEKCESLIKEGRQHNELVGDLFENVHDQQKKNEVWFKSLKTGMKDLEKRIISEVSKLIQKMELKTISQQKENLTTLRDLIVKENRTSNHDQNPDLDTWASSLENTFQRGFSDMFHSLEQLIERRLKKCECHKAAGRNVQVRSVGTSTDSEAKEERPMPNTFVQYTGFDKQSCRPHYKSSSEICVKEQHNRYGQTNFTQGMVYKVQMPCENHSSGLRNMVNSLKTQPQFSSVEQNVMDGEFEEYRGDSKFQQKLLVTSTNRNALPETGNSLQDQSQCKAKSFVSPFTNSVYPFPPKKGPSPCAVVEPQRQEVRHQMSSEMENKNCYLTKPQDVTKPGSKKKRKSVYTRKKNYSGIKKCKIDGLSPLKESVLLTQNQRSHKAPLQTPQSRQFRSTLQQITNVYNIPKQEKTNLRGQVLTSGRSSVPTKAFDPYNFDEPDSLSFPSTGMAMEKASNQNDFLKPQTSSYLRSFAAKKKSILLTPKIPILNMNQSATPQSSPSVSMLSMTMENKMRTPVKGIRGRVGPQDSSSYRVPNMIMKASNERDILSCL